MFEILQIVRLTEEVEKVPAGTEGTIVEAYKSGEAFIFECTYEGKPRLLDVKPDQIEPA